MKVYFGGAEIGSHRTLLQEADARHVALSYMGLRRRVKFSRPWFIKDKFWPGVSIFLDSGAYTLNNLKPDAAPVNEDEVLEIYEHYRDFVNANLDAIDLVSEFDVLSLGRDWIEEERDTYWATVPREKFMPIWHPGWGIPYLQEMASQYEIIGIPDTSLDGRELRPTLNSLVAQGTRLHGVAMTKMSEMQSIRWDSVASTSWISPQRFGDTIVWTGNALKRYPKKMKAEARKKHRTLFTNAGFNAEAIAADDASEVLRLSIWSWQQFEDYINRHGYTVDTQDSVVTPLFSSREVPNVENHDDLVDTQPESGGEKVSTPGRELVRREVNQVLPVMGISMQKVDADDEESEEIPVINVRSESGRICDTCFLAQKCPMFEPGSNCAYNIPISIKTRDQFRALRYAMVEMQAQRVMFMKMAEDVEGGYADPNLTKEMNLLDRMMNTVHEEEKEGFSINISATGPANHGSSGMISRLFGREAGQRVQELPAPVSVEDVVEAEWVAEDE